MREAEIIRLSGLVIALTWLDLPTSSPEELKRIQAMVRTTVKEIPWLAIVQK
jgi:hypothetical protein